MIKQKLLRAIHRSEAAYKLYLPYKEYYLALRIKRANEIVYALLEAYLYECDSNELDLIHQYLFHLEDWFHQFEALENKGLGLESEFVFNRLTNSPEFPKSIFQIF
jgi:hypothetical protein